jgi:hypothetical protein
MARLIFIQKEVVGQTNDLKADVNARQVLPSGSVSRGAGTASILAKKSIGITRGGADLSDDDCQRRIREKNITDSTFGDMIIFYV